MHEGNIFYQIPGRGQGHEGAVKFVNYGPTPDQYAPIGSTEANGGFHIRVLGTLSRA